MTDCLFCKIVAKEIPSTPVGETDRIYAFRDIAPSSPTHVLLIPKEHLADSVVAREQGLDAGYRVVINTGAEAGQTVFHVHFHLMGGWTDR